MNKNKTQIKTSLQRVRLTERERDHIRRSIPTESFAGEPYLLPLPSPYAKLFTRARLAFVCLVVLLLATAVPATYAAEKSLPGDPLYPIKTDVIEPIIEAFTLDQRERAEKVIKNAERRLEELMILFEVEEEEENIAIASDAFVKKMVKARNEISALNVPESAKIELQKKLLTTLETYVAVLERNGGDHYRSIIENVSTSGNSLQEDFVASIDTLFDASDTDTVRDTINSIVNSFSEEMEVESTIEDARINILTDAIDDAADELEHDDAREALKTLILSGQDAEVIKRLEKPVPPRPIPGPRPEI